MSRRLSVSQKGTVMEVRRVAVGTPRFVYAIVVPKALKYKWGSSKIAYIGRTQRGMRRIAETVAERADDVLSECRVQQLEVKVIVCSPRRHVQTWIKLEQAMLLSFRHRFGEFPVYNVSRQHTNETDEFEWFQASRIETILNSLSE